MQESDILDAGENFETCLDQHGDSWPEYDRRVLEEDFLVKQENDQGLTLDYADSSSVDMNWSSCEGANYPVQDNSFDPLELMDQGDWNNDSATTMLHQKLESVEAHVTAEPESKFRELTSKVDGWPNEFSTSDPKCIFRLNIPSQRHFLSQFGGLQDISGKS